MCTMLQVVCVTRSVISALKEVSPERRCYRLVGGVLVERQVKEVLPALEHNFTKVTVIGRMCVCEMYTYIRLVQLSALLETLSNQLTVKGKELNAFKQKHNIMLADEAGSKDSTPNTSSDSTKTGGLLVT